MKKVTKILYYHIEQFLFKELAIPKVKNEKISKVLLKKLLPRNPIIIDCGAHDGSDTIELAKKLKGKIHAFEPVNHLFDRLKLNTQQYSNVSCYQIALGDCNGIQQFYVSEGQSDGSSSLMPPKEHLVDHPETSFNQIIKVDVMTLDFWAESFGIERIDLLWLDMQGFELNMLRASSKILDTVKVIHTEVSTKETYVGVPLYPEYKAYLESKGFKVYIEAIPKGWDMGNVLFVKN